ncbi:recombination-associated protein RdgC [Cupriavidus malaysiensis]|uniref:Recombination-associated protein RdgC n=1 Tax=Cupriavidus malaysiensis TaxID=367825 RepID=A0ABN4TZD4_9BURK|nr:recombination-associated protein RdgC [Cupriavidus malaysiensis]AOZ11100.1 recombination-associated protein RdgC [Cupriavidus malaysiensis]
MWFRNLTILRVRNFRHTSEALESMLGKQAFHSCSELELAAQGWAPPRQAGLAHTVGRQILLHLCFEKKLLPNAVINEVVRSRAAEIEEQLGFKPGRKQMRELKEQVIEELIPRAFSIKSTVAVWIDPVSGWLIIDSASRQKVDAVVGMLFKCIDPLNAVTLQTALSPVAAMTGWLASDTSPAGFTVDQDAELQKADENKASVKFSRHVLQAEEVARHISAGKRCTQLAMTWNDRISFVLTENLALKRVAPLDVVKERAASESQSDDDLFDSDFTLMSGELAGMLAALVESLGGERSGEEEDADIQSLTETAEA